MLSEKVSFTIVLVLTGKEQLRYCLKAGFMWSNTLEVFCIMANMNV
uniref:Uncharacterized protein n=1 Tax=Rhizophora mucronata TaxID=61149 RepID=A0A2P2N3W7_RHIMU